jgi:hypothetical protein
MIYAATPEEIEKRRKAFADGSGARRFERHHRSNSRD